MKPRIVSQLMLGICRRRPLAFALWLVGSLFAAHAAEFKPTSFLAQHCTECHDAQTKKGNLDLTALRPDFADAENFARWVKLHDRVQSGEMPPAKKPRPATSAGADRKSTRLNSSH